MRKMIKKKSSLQRGLEECVRKEMQRKGKKQKVIIAFNRLLLLGFYSNLIFLQITVFRRDSTLEEIC